MKNPLSVGRNRHLPQVHPRAMLFDPRRDTLHRTGRHTGAKTERGHNPCTVGIGSAPTQRAAP